MRYLGRIDLRLCPDGQVPTPDAVIDPLIGGGESIKTGEVSDVYRVQWAGRDLVVKRYNHVGLMHSLRHTLKGSRARRGWINGQRLLEMGIPTPCPVAYIDERRGPLLWRSYLITEFTDGRRLDEVLEDETVLDGAKRRLIHQVLKLIHRLSRHGVNHGDPKHTNILCVEGRVVLTDLDSVETHQWEWLHRRRQTGDIARFLRDIGGPEARGDCEHGPNGSFAKSGGATQCEFVSKVFADGEMHLNGHFACTEELAESLWQGEEGIRRRCAPTVMESSRNSRVLRFRASCGGERTIYFKEYLRRSPVDWLKELFYPCRALRAFHASHMLTESGFLSPTVIAAGWAGRGRLGKRSFLATEEVTDARPIYKYLVRPHCDENPCTLRDRRNLLRAIGRTVGRMHRAGIIHGDLRPGNVLARKVAGCWEFFFLDNERTRKWPWLPTRLRLKNLVQINMLPHGISRTDRMRFFQAYMLANPSVCATYKEWAERIMARTRRRFRRKGWA
jgi:tRNA A-37 threonylcarbamoyl transferase component Bud32